MDNVLNFNRNSKIDTLLRDQANNAEHVRKTMQYTMEKLAEGATTAIGTIRRYTRKTNNAIYGLFGSTSSLALWAMSEPNVASNVTADFLVNSIKSIASNLTTTPVSSLSAHDVALTGSLANRFALADDPEFVSDLVAEAIETHRDVALRDISAMANDTFVGPYRPATANLINEFKAGETTFEQLQDAILERRGLALTEGACNSFGVAVCPHQLNTLRNSFGNTGASTTNPVWTYVPKQEVITARSLDLEPTATPAYNYVKENFNPKF